MEDGATMAKRMGKFDELIVGLQTLGGDRAVTQGIRATEKKEATELALKATSNGGKLKNGMFGKDGKYSGRNGNAAKKNSSFKDKCFNCDQVGHMKRGFPNKDKYDVDDTVFAVGEGRSTGWLIDSGAISHKTPHREDLFDYMDSSTAIEVLTIADGKKLRVAGTGSVSLTGIDGERIRMVEVLHIPGLYRRLLSVGKFGRMRYACRVSTKARHDLEHHEGDRVGEKVDKAYLLDGNQETAQYVEYKGIDSEWELWYARMGHLNGAALMKT
ncbi:Integrase, catalytic core protein [Phytophthora megakarya]|uniref:Integrase, catalytic core protein n=1 Tax=Phytophthora megakarya TaxID=4795 RepID=A0A225VRM4_9STRA|nr:Integrase, catalytic core protein [Phytophthora megakarya]